MADPLKEPKHPVQELVKEVERGRSPRTPLLALSGVMLLVSVAAALLILALFLIYYLV